MARQQEKWEERLARKKKANEDKKWDAEVMIGQIVATTQANDTAAKLALEGQRGKQDSLVRFD